MGETKIGDQFKLNPKEVMAYVDGEETEFLTKQS